MGKEYDESELLLDRKKKSNVLSLLNLKAAKIWLRYFEKIKDTCHLSKATFF